MSNKNINKRGALGTIISLFLISAAVRVATSVPDVQAQVASETETEDNVLSHEKSKDENGEEVNFKQVLEAFEQRENRIKQQEEKIALRMKALQIVESKTKQRLEELQSAEASLRETLSLASTAAEDDLARLTTVYENMKPKVAAGLFGEMSPEFAAGFMSRMKPETTAAIMAGLSPDHAYSISAILAGRNANVPTQ